MSTATNVELSPAKATENLIQLIEQNKTEAKDAKAIIKGKKEATNLVSLLVRELNTKRRTLLLQAYSLTLRDMVAFYAAERDQLFVFIALLKRVPVYKNRFKKDVKRNEKTLDDFLKDIVKHEKTRNAFIENAVRKLSEKERTELMGDTSTPTQEDICTFAELLKLWDINFEKRYRIDGKEPDAKINGSIAKELKTLAKLHEKQWVDSLDRKIVRRGFKEAVGTKDHFPKNLAFEQDKLMKAIDALEANLTQFINKLERMEVSSGGGLAADMLRAAQEDKEKKLSEKERFDFGEEP